MGNELPFSLMFLLINLRGLCDKRKAYNDEDKIRRDSTPFSDITVTWKFIVLITCVLYYNGKFNVKTDVIVSVINYSQNKRLRISKTRWGPELSSRAFNKHSSFKNAKQP